MQFDFRNFASGCAHLSDDRVLMGGVSPGLLFVMKPSIAFPLPHVEGFARFTEQDVDVEYGVSHSVLRRGLHGQGGDGAGTLSFPDPDYITVNTMLKSQISSAPR